jgi:hypothetical protein
MRCREIVTDFKYESKGKSYFGNFLIIEEVQDHESQAFFNQVRAAEHSFRTKRNLDRFDEGTLRWDFFWLVSVDLKIANCFLHQEKDDEEYPAFNSHYTLLKLPSELSGNSLAGLVSQLHRDTKKDQALHGRLFSKNANMNGIIEDRIDLANGDIPNVMTVAHELENALNDPQTAKDEYLAYLYIAGRARDSRHQSDYERAIAELKSRQRNQFGHFSLLSKVSPLELTARRTRSAKNLGEFTTKFPGDCVFDGMQSASHIWESRLKNFLGALSDDELCELLLAFWMTGQMEDLRLKIVVLEEESRTHGHR